MDLGRTLVTKPRSFPAALWVVIRRWIRKVWDTRGGGLYACGFVITFVWLEATTVISEFAASDGIAGFFGGQLIEFLMRFTVDSIVNTVHAFLWPVHVIRFSPPWGIVFLGAMYVGFTYVLQRPLERWLFHDADAAAKPPASDADTKE